MSCAVDQDAAAIRRLEAREHAQQRGLAAARGAQQREELAARDVEPTSSTATPRAEALATAFDTEMGSLSLPLIGPS